MGKAKHKLFLLVLGEAGGVLGENLESVFFSASGRLSFIDTEFAGTDLFTDDKGVLDGGSVGERDDKFHGKDVKELKDDWEGWLGSAN